MKKKSSRYFKYHGYKSKIDDNCVDFGHWWFCYRKKFYGSLIKRGLKYKALRRFQKLLVLLKAKEGISGNSVLFVSLLKLTPKAYIGQKRSSGHGSFYPKYISANKKVTLAIRWIVKTFADKNPRRVASVDKMAHALIGALRQRGEAYEHKRKIMILIKSERSAS